MRQLTITKIGNLGRIITGKTPSTLNPDFYGGTIPFITPTDMVGTKTIVRTQRYLSTQGRNSVNSSYIPPHSICVSCIGSDMGKVVMTHEWAVTNQQINSIIVNESFDYRYIYYLMRTLENRIRNLGKNSTAVPILNKTKFSNIEIKVFCDLQYQTRIADILSAYDDLIENNQKQIRLLEEAAQRLYKEWFIDLHFPGHETTPIINGIPEGWECGRADSYFEISIGKTPSRAESQWFTGAQFGVPWASISDMGECNAFISETAEGLTREAVEKFHVKLVPPNTVLLSFKLTVGRVAITSTEMCTNEAIAHFQTNEMQRDYVYLYLKSFQYDTLGSTSSISKAVNSKIVKSMPFVMPSKEVLLAFERVVRSYFDMMHNKSLQIKQLKEARDRLLPKLMSGEIEV